MTTIDQTIEVARILKNLNRQDIPTSTIEKELPIAAGYLYKVKKGKKTLSKEKLKDLQEYHRKKIMILPTSIKPTILIPKQKTLPAPIKKVIEINSGSEKKISLASYLGPRPKVESSYKRSKI